MEKDQQAAEQKRPEVAAARHIWITKRQPFMADMLTRIGFVDETRLKTNMATTASMPPWVIDGPINRALFDLYIETQLAPALKACDVIILDNLSSHESPKASAILGDIGARFLPLPPCSPDLNPIEMAFATLKALLRKAAARTCEALWNAVGAVCDLFTEDECLNYFIAAGYKPE